VSTLDPSYPLGELDIPLLGPRGNGGEIPRGPLGPSRLELDKPVIAAIEGPAVAGGMELGLWCDFPRDGARRLLRRVLPALGRAAHRRRHRAPAANRGPGPRARDHPHGRQVRAEECLAIGLCEYVTEPGGARAKAEALAQDIARFPQTCMRADRRSAIRSHGLPVRDALIQEWYNGREALVEDGVAGASRFRDGPRPPWRLRQDPLRARPYNRRVPSTLPRGPAHRQHRAQRARARRVRTIARPRRRGDQDRAAHGRSIGGLLPRVVPAAP
jgi:enoyl-CoA hydratase